MADPAVFDRDFDLLVAERAGIVFKGFEAGAGRVRGPGMNRGHGGFLALGAQEFCGPAR
jgi:hypothetical protein